VPRILALDHGSVRIGVALSDESKLFASPLEVIPAQPGDPAIRRIEQLVAEKDVELIVVGMPRNMNGTYGPAAEKVRAFIQQLQPRIAVPIRTWDERLTSAQAERALIEAEVRRADRRGKVDKTAAAILLQSYLDSLAPG
jgi:putative Holliday junction resolvase